MSLVAQNLVNQTGGPVTRYAKDTAECFKESVSTFKLDTGGLVFLTSQPKQRSSALALEFPFLSVCVWI